MVPTVVPISRTQTLNRFAFTQPEGIAGTLSSWASRSRASHQVTAPSSTFLST
jgi:hypothetical protein